MTELDPPPSKTLRPIIVMGVSGCGKSTIGATLARRLNCPYTEGDDLHSTGARAKMAAGTHLTDNDRWPWLKRVAQRLEKSSDASGFAVASCSALKKSYRDALAAQLSQPAIFIYLELTEDDATRRLNNRPHHFMPATLVKSQFQALEPPQSDETCITIDATLKPCDIVQLAYSALKT